jgi:hypothetical protein
MAFLMETAQIIKELQYIFVLNASRGCSETSLTGESRFHISTPQGM